MEGLNRVQLLGNLGSDPELKQTGAGSVLKLRLATSERYLDKDRQPQERTEWHNVSVWGKRAEGLSRILTKGSRLFVEGAIRSSQYEKNGEKRTSYEIAASNILLQGGGKPANTNAAPRGSESQPSFPTAADDDDIPF